MRVGFDIDGVLADFCHPYEWAFRAVTGRNDFAPFHPMEGPVSWNWPSDRYGYTKEETSAVWKMIKESTHFWRDLPIAPGFITFREWWKANQNVHEIYFVTARPGVNAKKQTEQWFNDCDVFPVTVLISDQKGEVAHALNLDYYVDDKAENILQVREQSPLTHAYLIDRAYNRHMNPGGTRIASLEEFLTVISH